MLRVEMNGNGSRALASLVCLSAAAGCDGWTDAATRLAYDIEADAGHLGGHSGAKLSIRHDNPSKAGERIGPYTVQLDKVGALIIDIERRNGQAVVADVR